MHRKPVETGGGGVAAGRTESKGESRGCRGAAASGAAPHPRLAASPGPPGGCRRDPTAELGAAPGAPAGRGSSGAGGTGLGRRRALRDGAAGTGRPGAGLPRRGGCAALPPSAGCPGGTGRYRAVPGGTGVPGGARGARAPPRAHCSPRPIRARPPRGRQSPAGAAR